MKTSLVHRLLALVIAVAVAAATATAQPAGASTLGDPFYRYTGSATLESIAPGTVLRTRHLPYHLAGIPLPLRTTQLLFRTTGARGQATLGVTTVVRPLLGAASRHVVSYQSFYDSSDPADQPSSVIAGSMRLPGGTIATFETGLVLRFLLAGSAVVITDVEGQDANIGAGPEYGHNTLDGLRAAFADPTTGIAADAKVGMIGYSGGAVDLTPYLSERGLELTTKMQHATIAAALGQYPGLRFADLVKPQYREPESIPELVEIANQLIMGQDGTPSTPLFIGQGRRGRSRVRRAPSRGSARVTASPSPATSAPWPGRTATAARTCCTASTR